MLCQIFSHVPHLGGLQTAFSRWKSNPEPSFRPQNCPEGDPATRGAWKGIRRTKMTLCDDGLSQLAFPGFYRKPNMSLLKVCVVLRCRIPGEAEKPARKAIPCAAK